VLADHSLGRVAVRSATLAAVVLIVAVPVYVYVEPSWRAFVARLACAFVLGVALLQFRRALLDRLADLGGSALDTARGRREPEPGVPHHFHDLARDVRTALRSRRYFDKVLWPRLQTLTPDPLPRPAGRPGRGPSLASLRRVIIAIEKRS
jgi:hypothetical protein